MDKSAFDDKKDKETWEKSNRKCIMIMKMAILEVFRGFISDKITTTKEFIAYIENRFIKNKKKLKQVHF